MKGSLTVEAALVFPFCFLILLLFCELGIYQYDQAVLKLTGYECILRTMEERQLEDKVLRDRLLERAKEHGQARTFGVEELEADVKITKSEVLLTYSGRQSFLKSPVNVTVTYQRIHPEQSLRRSRNLIGAAYVGVIKKRIE